MLCFFKVEDKHNEQFRHGEVTWYELETTLAEKDNPRDFYSTMSMIDGTLKPSRMSLWSKYPRVTSQPRQNQSNPR